MSVARPRVSIGMPVYNGERFLREALDSILAQTFTDFELIISDNASTDATQEICRSYASRDSRIHYHRNDRNLGAAQNFNRTFKLSSGEYFKWAAHDDVLAPKYLEKCVETLDNAPPSVVLCLPRTIIIDASGIFSRQLGFIENSRRLDAISECHELRFFHAVRIGPGGAAQVAFGLMRSSALRRTRLMGAYRTADWVFAAEISLWGRIRQIPDYLFFLRLYGQHVRRRNRGEPEEAAWWASAQNACVVRHRMCKILLEDIRAIRHSDLGWFAKTCRHFELSGFIGNWLLSRYASLAWRARSWVSLQAMLSSEKKKWPLRLWTFARLLRGRHRWRPDRAMREATSTKDADLLFAVAQALVRRHDSSSQELLIEWLADPRESRRVAVAMALRDQPERFAEILRGSLRTETSGPVLAIILDALQKCTACEDSLDVATRPRNKSNVGHQVIYQMETR